jgi:hypothetical protein
MTLFSAFLLILEATSFMHYNKGMLLKCLFCIQRPMMSLAERLRTLFRLLSGKAFTRKTSWFYSKKYFDVYFRKT